MISPFLQRTARAWLIPKSGSTLPFSEIPTISPLAFTQVGSLQLLLCGGKAPRSLTVPFHSKACVMNGMTPSIPPQMNGWLVGEVGVEVADQPTVTPGL